MIDLTKMSAEEFNSAFIAAIGEFITVDFPIAAGHLAVITAIQYVNTDSVPHTVFVRYQGAGVAGAVANVVGYTVPAGASQMLVPGDSSPSIDTRISGPFEFVGPCTLTLEDVTAMVTVTAMGFKINWLEGIATAEIAGAVAPTIAAAP